MQKELSWCYSIDLTEDDELIVSGVIQTGGSSSKTSALIMKLDEQITHSTPIIKAWSNSKSPDGGYPSQYGLGVHTTLDGGIFVTGSIQTAFVVGTLGNMDCYIMRMNYTLDVIWAKSFGTSDYDDCRSI